MTRGNEGDWFRAGLEAAAMFHEKRSEFTRDLIQDLGANPNAVPEEIRENLLEDYKIEVAKDLNTAHHIRELEPPVDMPTLVKEAWEARENQSTKAILEIQETLRSTRNRETKVGLQVKGMTSLLREALAHLQSEHKGGSLCTRIENCLGDLDRG